MSKTQKEKDAKKADNRSRNFTIVFYPDDLPSNWIELVSSIHCKWVLSPLHDRDFNADGTPKKSHYHAIFMFGTLKSLKQIDGLFRNLFGKTVDEHGVEVITSGSIPGVANINSKSIIHDRNATMRYLCHMDNPEKAQYCVNDIQAFNGADVMELLKHSQTEVQVSMIAMEEFIEDNNITELCDFTRLIRYTHPDWYLIVSTKSTVYFSNFIRSRRHSLREQFEQFDNKKI